VRWPPKDGQPTPTLKTARFPHGLKASKLSGWNSQSRHEIGLQLGIA
jgi:hypothetical protein